MDFKILKKINKDLIRLIDLRIRQIMLLFKQNWDPNLTHLPTKPRKQTPSPLRHAHDVAFLPIPIYISLHSNWLCIYRSARHFCGSCITTPPSHRPPEYYDSPAVLRLPGRTRHGRGDGAGVQPYCQPWSGAAARSTRWMAPHHRVQEGRRRHRFLPFAVLRDRDSGSFASCRFCQFGMVSIYSFIRFVVFWERRRGQSWFGDFCARLTFLCWYLNNYREIVWE